MPQFAQNLVPIARFNLAWVVGSLGDRPRERALTEEILRRARAAGDSGLWQAAGPVERTVAIAQASNTRRSSDGRAPELQTKSSSNPAVRSQRGTTVRSTCEASGAAPGKVIAHLARLPRSGVEIVG